jgi:O-antigen/teichoic acid export membrane protein
MRINIDRLPAGRELIRGATLTSSGAVLGIALDFLFFVIAVRSVPQSDFGVFGLFLVLGRFAQVLADFGLRQSVVHALSTQEERKGETFRIILGMQAVFSLATATGLFLAFQPLSSLLSLSDVPAYMPLALSFFVLVQGLHQLMSGTLQGLRLYRRYVAGEFTRSVTRLALVVIFVVWLEDGLAGLVVSTIAAVALSCLLQLFLVPLPKWPSWTHQGAADVLRFACPLGLNNLLGVTFGRVDRLLLAAYAGPASVALLETASKAPEGGTQVYMGFQSVFFPNMSSLLGSDRKDEAARILRHTLRLVAFLTAAVAAVAFKQRGVSASSRRDSRSLS